MPLKESYPVIPPAEDKRGPDEPRHLWYFFPEPNEEPEMSRFLWLRSDYSEQNEAQLCRTCRQISFRYLSLNTSPYDICLGSYGDVRRRECTFCQLVLEEPTWALRSFQQLGLRDTDRVVVSSKMSHPRSNWSKNGVRDVLGFIVLQVWTYRRGPGSYGIGLTYSIIHMTQEQGRPNAIPLSGKSISAHYDPEAVKQWLHDCAQYTTQSRSTNRNMAGYVERLIDTTDQCLVEVGTDAKMNLLTSLDEIKFAALSYVWGPSGQQLSLSKASFKDMHEKNSISTSDSKISATIRDCIILCKEVGIRYLWVDALCIVQDDHNKLRQIKNMHHVYQNASMTIVAACGENANSGLPGVHSTISPERQAVLKIQRLKLIKESLNLDDMLVLCYWSTRAWTFQEFLLSPRALIFTKNTIYFSCPHGIRVDDVVSPPHQSDFTYYGELTRSGFGFQPGDKLNWTTYAELASSYTARNLTNEKDRVPAFLALSQVLADDLFQGIPFVSNLPYSNLDAALLWRRCLGCRLCRNSNSGLERRGGFRRNQRNDLDFPPSWSWAGWIGHIQYSKFILSDENPSWSVIPRVTWLEAIQPFEIYPSTTRDNISFSSIQTWAPPPPKDATIWKQKYGGFVHEENGNVIYSHPIPTNSIKNRTLVHPTTGSLHLEAEIATFRLEGRLFKQMTSVKETDDYLLDGTVIYGAKIGDPLEVIDKKTSFRCGVLYNDLDFATLNITFPADLSFIKLSQTTLQETYRSAVPEALSHITPGIGVRDCPKDTREMLPNKVNRYFDYDKYGYGNLWCLYNVLAVLWDGDTAFRVGVGKIHADAFDTADDLTRKVFWLG